MTTDSDQIGQILMGEEELKVRRIGQDAMMEQDAVHIGYEADPKKSPTSGRQSRNDLRIRKETNNCPPHGRTRSLDELPVGREFGRLRSVHLGQRFRQEFRCDD